MSEMRERFRAQVQGEIRAAATAQLAAGGVGALSLNAIAKELGVSGPALYRYVASREALLDDLVVAAYTDLVAAVRGSDGLAGFAHAFRAWALAQPHRYGLLFAAPTAGGDLAEPVVQAAHDLMEQLAARLPGQPEPAGRLGRDLRRWASARPGEVDPASALAAVSVWARLHGFVSLEIQGNFASMGLDPDLLFEREVAALTERVG